MLIGESWVLEHLQEQKQIGNSKVGRDWVARFRFENQLVLFRCDACGSEEKAGIEEKVGGHRLDRGRHLVRRALKLEQLFGKHLCTRCVLPYKNAKTKVTMGTPEYKARRAAQPSWQSTASLEKLRVWKQMGASTRKEITQAKTPEERRIGVVKQWETMTPKVKQTRAEKIGVAMKAIWASLSPEHRDQRVKRMVKGLPRSGVSDKFRQALIDAGLYTGFQSEVAISGFIADEGHQELKAIIEFFGDFYHCNPRRYTDPNFYNRVIHMTAAQRWQYDRRRLAAFRKIGFDPLVVWESDWTTAPGEVLKRVREFLVAKRLSYETNRVEG